jgi:hypothetical protein
MPQLVRDRNLVVSREAGRRIGGGIVVVQFSHEHGWLLLLEGTGTVGLSPRDMHAACQQKGALGKSAH